MLTFFRRIRKSLLGSGNTGKYLLYAIGEILLVMVGILLALQVNNWNEWRKERKKEELLLTEINKEFRFNKKEFEGTIDVYRQMAHNCQVIMSLFPIETKQLDIDSLSNLLTVLVRTPSADLLMGSINSLINASSFDIISNKELRSLLLQWKELYSDYQGRETHDIDYTKDYFIPYFNSKVLQPFNKGLKDARVDLTFLNTVEFENIIYHKHLWISRMLAISERDENGTLEFIQNIIQLSDNNEIGAQ